MKLPLKIALISLAVVCTLSVLLMLASSPNSKGAEYLLAIGIGCLSGGFISLVVAVVFFIGKSRVWGQGFLLSSGLLLLVGFATCTGGLASSFNVR